MILGYPESICLLSSLLIEMKPKTKFLTVIWGETYIERFCALSLPSFLAPGNLPALAQETDLEVVIMTRHDDFAFFERNITYKRLRKICPVRFVDIDDLIATSIYGVTLTLAYIRPIIACGDDMLHTHFVFMNADFVLADGSLRALCKHIHDGRAIVLAPSFRSTAESVEPKLEAAVDVAAGVLSIAPRQLVELSLAHPHRTTIAKIQNQRAFHSSHPNQFFWQVDEHTFLGRYFLIFMLCLKPERVIKSINCYCDYSFIPEMCPSGDEVAMNDSDDFFMLELQSREQETHMLRHGPMSEPEIVNSLQEWTTAEHRRAANHEIVFHSRDIPPEIESAKAEAKLFIDGIKQKLGRPKAHINHRYWVYGVEAWKGCGGGKGGMAALPELAPYSLDSYFRYHQARGRLSRKVRSYTSITLSTLETGRLSKTWFSPFRRENQLLHEVVRAVVAASGGSLILAVGRRDRGPIRELDSLQADVRFVSEKETEPGDADYQQPVEEVAQALLYLESADIEAMRRKVEYCLSAMSTKAALHIVLKLNASEASDTDVSRLVFGLEDIFGNRLKTLSTQSVGGAWMHFNRMLYWWIADKLATHTVHYRRFGLIALAWSVPIVGLGVLFVTLSSLACNLHSRLREPSPKIAQNCSTFVIRAQLWGR